MKELTTEEFKEKIFDYTKGDEWKFKGDKPTIIDFSALWCQPCKILTPILDELSVTYNGKVDFYKVDVDAEQEVSAVFGIKSIPSMLFVPNNVDPPQMAQGALPKEQIINVIKDLFKVNNGDDNDETITEIDVTEVENTNDPQSDIPQSDIPQSDIPQSDIPQSEN